MDYKYINPDKSNDDFLNYELIDTLPKALEAMKEISNYAGIYTYSHTHMAADYVLCTALKLMLQDELVDVYDRIRKWFA